MCKSFRFYSRRSRSSRMRKANERMKVGVKQQTKETKKRKKKKKIKLHSRGNSQLSIDKGRKKESRVIVITVVCTRGMTPVCYFRDGNIASLMRISTRDAPRRAVVIALKHMKALSRGQQRFHALLCIKCGTLKSGIVSEHRIGR